jgi:hypothetical protein
VNEAELAPCQKRCQKDFSALSALASPEALHSVIGSLYDSNTRNIRNRGIMSTITDWAQALMSPSPVALIIDVLLVLSIPLFLHYFVFRASGLTNLPSILLIGPSGSGKTSLLTLVNYCSPFQKDVEMLIRTTVRARHLRGPNPHVPIPPLRRMPPPSRHHRLLRQIPLSQRPHKPHPQKIPPHRHARPR